MPVASRKLTLKCMKLPLQQSSLRLWTTSLDSEPAVAPLAQEYSMRSFWSLSSEASPEHQVSTSLSIHLSAGPLPPLCSVLLRVAVRPAICASLASYSASPRLRLTLMFLDRVNSMAHVPAAAEKGAETRGVRERWLLAPRRPPRRAAAAPEDRTSLRDSAEVGHYIAGAPCAACNP